MATVFPTVECVWYCVVQPAPDGSAYEELDSGVRGLRARWEPAAPAAGDRAMELLLLASDAKTRRLLLCLKPGDLVRFTGAGFLIELGHGLPLTFVMKNSDIEVAQQAPSGTSADRH